MQNRNTVDPVAVAKRAGSEEAAAAEARAEASALLRGYNAPRVTLAVTLAERYAEGSLSAWSPSVARDVVAEYAKAAGRPVPSGQSLAVQASKLAVCVRAGQAFVDTIKAVREIVANASEKERSVFLKDVPNKVPSLGRACLARKRALTHNEIMLIITDGSSDPEKVYRLVSTACAALVNAEKLSGSQSDDFKAAINAVAEIAERWRAVADAAKRERVDSMSRIIDDGRGDLDAEADEAIPEGDADQLSI